MVDEKKNTAWPEGADENTVWPLGAPTGAANNTDEARARVHAVMALAIEGTPDESEEAMSGMDAMSRFTLNMWRFGVKGRNATRRGSMVAPLADAKMRLAGCAPYAQMQHVAGFYYGGQPDVGACDHAADAMSWLRAAGGPTPLHMEHAMSALPAGDYTGLVELTAALHDSALDVYRVCGFNEETTAMVEPPNEAFAVYLEGKGDNGRSMAKAVRASDGWRMWVDLARCPVFGRWGSGLAKVLWLDVVQRQVADEAARKAERDERRSLRPHVASPRPVAGIFRPMGKAATLREWDDKKGIHFDVRLPGKRTLAHAYGPYEQTASLRKALTGLQSSYGFRLLAMVRDAAHEHWVETGHETSPILGFKGAKGLAVALGATGKAAPSAVMEAVRGGQALRVKFPDSSIMSGLWSYHQQGKRGALFITPSGWFNPGHVQNAFKSTSNAWMVGSPYTSPAHAPLVGRTNDHAAQMAFHMALEEAWSMRSAELARNGSVALSDETLATMASECGMAHSILPNVLGVMEAPAGEGQLPLLSRDGGRYRPADPARFAWYVEQGKRYASRQACGRATAAKKRRAK